MLDCTFIIPVLIFSLLMDVREAAPGTPSIKRVPSGRKNRLVAYLDIFIDFQSFWDRSKQHVFSDRV